MYVNDVPEERGVLKGKDDAAAAKAAAHELSNANALFQFFFEEEVSPYSPWHYMYGLMWFLLQIAL